MYTYLTIAFKLKRLDKYRSTEHVVSSKSINFTDGKKRFFLLASSHR